MVAAKKWIQIDPKDTIILAPITLLSDLEERKALVLAIFQAVEDNITQNNTKNTGRDPNKSYAEGLSNV